MAAGKLVATKEVPQAFNISGINLKLGFGSFTLGSMNENGGKLNPLKASVRTCCTWPVTEFNCESAATVDVDEVPSEIPIGPIVHERHHIFEVVATGDQLEYLPITFSIEPRVVETITPRPKVTMPIRWNEALDHRFKIDHSSRQAL